MTKVKNKWLWIASILFNIGVWIIFPFIKNENLKIEETRKAIQLNRLDSLFELKRAPLELKSLYDSKYKLFHKDYEESRTYYYTKHGDTLIIKYIAYNASLTKIESERDYYFFHNGDELTLDVNNENLTKAKWMLYVKKDSLPSKRVQIENRKLIDSLRKGF